jgi:peptidoglycan/LPS O-acetylase OafA/YrhL
MKPCIKLFFYLTITIFCLAFFAVSSVTISVESNNNRLYNYNYNITLSKNSNTEIQNSNESLKIKNIHLVYLISRSINIPVNITTHYSDIFGVSNGILPINITKVSNLNSFEINDPFLCIILSTLISMVLCIFYYLFSMEIKKKPLQHTINPVNHNRNNFDFIRFIAASSVIISHSVPLTNNGSSYINELTKGQIDLGAISVNTFFVISGYLILSSYIRMQSIPKYLLARVLRIYPALIVVSIFTALIVGPIVTKLSLYEYFNSNNTWLYLFNTTVPISSPVFSLPGFYTGCGHYTDAVNGSIWTIGWEVKCYLLVIIIGFLRLLNKNLVLTITSVMVLYYGVLNHEEIRLYTYFFIGMCFYLFKENIRYKYFITGIALISIFLACFFGKYLNLTLLIAGSYLLFGFSFSKKIKFYHFGKYGDFSYGIYLYGFLIQQLVMIYFHGSMNNTLNYMISLPIAVMCGIASYFCIEKPCMNLKNKILQL